MLISRRDYEAFEEACSIELFGECEAWEEEEGRRREYLNIASTLTAALGEKIWEFGTIGFPNIASDRAANWIAADAKLLDIWTRFHRRYLIQKELEKDLRS
jgi:hypothetical protein